MEKLNEVPVAVYIVLWGSNSGPLPAMAVHENEKPILVHSGSVTMRSTSAGALFSYGAPKPTQVGRVYDSYADAYDYWVMRKWTVFCDLVNGCGSLPAHMTIEDLEKITTILRGDSGA